MSNFKVGDKVRCIDVSVGGGELELNREYTVSDAFLSTFSSYPSVRLVGLTHAQAWWYAKRFELVEEPKNKPRKHAAIIKAWADGAVVEVRSHQEGKWFEINSTPAWSVDLEYRVKPEPKPDVVKYGVAKLLDTGLAAVYYLGERNTTIGQNLCLTFDGETRELKSASVINKD